MKKVEEIEAEIRGSWFHGREARRAANGLVVGQPLMLFREPENRWDRNAIIVRTLFGQSVGYVAREIAARVAPEIDAGYLWLAKVVKEHGRKRTAFPIALLWKERPEKEDIIHENEEVFDHARRVLERIDNF